MTPGGVQVWFQNRRAKSKNEKRPLEKKPHKDDLYLPNDIYDCQPKLKEVKRSRANSCPNVHSDLPIKDLHEILFTPIPEELPTYKDSLKVESNKPRKNSGCSINFLNSFLNMGFPDEMGPIDEWKGNFELFQFE